MKVHFQIYQMKIQKEQSKDYIIRRNSVSKIQIVVQMKKWVKKHQSDEKEK